MGIARHHDLIVIRGMLATDAALLVYRATARRAEHATYVTRASSVYVRQEGVWTLAFH